MAARLGANVTQSRDELMQVLNCFPETAGRAESTLLQRVASGLSGASVWRLNGTSGDWAVRRWPEGYDENRLTWIHQVLLGLPQSLPLPIPLRTLDGQSFARRGDSLWSVEPWMRGEANYWREPSDKKLVAAVQALAAFHRAVQDWASGPQLIPAIANRIVALKQHSDSVAHYAKAIGDSRDELPRLSREILVGAQFQIVPWQRALNAVAQASEVLVPCMRDVWHDHVLFVGDRVSGLIDFGSLRLDSIATDFARLVGSLVDDDERQWRLALDAYRSAGNFAQGNVSLIGVIDGSSQVIAGLNWVRWLFVEKRSFENQTLVDDRLKRILRRLSHPREFEI